MRKVVSRCVVCGVIAVLAFGFGVRPYLAAQDATKPAVKAEEGKGEKKASGDRLPANYGKIGLSDAQRKSIYEICGRHGKEIDELEKKIAELKMKEVAECEAILNPNQRQSLQDLKAEAKKKAASKKKDATKDDSSKKEKEAEKK